MTESANTPKTSRLPDTSSQVVRQHWLELLDLSYANRRVTLQEIEPGVHAVVAPSTCRQEMSAALVEAEVRVAAARVPGMARGVRLALERIDDFALTLRRTMRVGWARGARTSPLEIPARRCLWI